MHPLLRLPYAAAGLAADAASRLTPGREGKIARSLGARRGLVTAWERWARDHRDPARPLIWMHAPSVGEGLQARPVLSLLRARRPSWQLVYTHFSPSAERFAQGLDVDHADYLPFDTAGSARRMLAALRPSALVFAKLDAWPILCEEASRLRVPLGMVSATAGPAAARRGRLARALLADAHAAFDAVGAISDEDAARLRQLGFRAGAVRVTGDTRYDQVAARAASVDRAHGFVAALASERPTLVAGSSWPADEAVLLPAWEELLRTIPTARLIIAPHEPTDRHLAPLLSWAAGTGRTHARLPDATADTDIVVVDRVGVLGDLYALATVAWVGGGHHAAGLHSVLEPAAFGAPVLFGPRHLNSRDAGLLLDAGSARVAADTRMATTELVSWLGDAAAQAAAGAAALRIVDQGLGAAERAFTLVVDLVER